MKSKQNPIELLQEMLDELQRTHAIENDPSTKFKLKHQILETQEEIDRLKRKSPETDQNSSNSGKDPNSVDVNLPLPSKSIKYKSILNKINCNRDKIVRDFCELMIREHKDYENSRPNYFFILPADKVQRPRSLVNRLIYELEKVLEFDIDKILDVDGLMSHDVMENVSIRAFLDDLRLPMFKNLELNIDEFRKGFKKWLNIETCSSLTEFYSKETRFSHKLYQVVTIRAKSDQWSPATLEFIQWLNNEFCFLEQPCCPKFLFILYIELENNDNHKKGRWTFRNLLAKNTDKYVMDDLAKLTKRCPQIICFDRLESVKLRHLKDWLRECMHIEFDRDQRQAIELLIQKYDPQLYADLKRKNDFENHPLEMDSIEWIMNSYIEHIKKHQNQPKGKK